MEEKTISEEEKIFTMSDNNFIQDSASSRLREISRANNNFPSQTCFVSDRNPEERNAT